MVDASGLARHLPCWVARVGRRFGEESARRVAGLVNETSNVTVRRQFNRSSGTRRFDSSNSYLGRFPRSDWPSRLETNWATPLGFGAFRLAFELRAKLEPYLRFYNTILHNT